MHATSIIGSHDDREDQYNLTIETADDDGFEKAYTLSYTESRRGWVSFKSFITQGGISHKNTYYTFPSNEYSFHFENDPWGVQYAIPSEGVAETWQHNLDIRLKRGVAMYSSNSSTIRVDNGSGILLPGMNVTGSGIQADTEIINVGCQANMCLILLTKPATVSTLDTLSFSTPRNSFYGKDEHYSMLKVLFNQQQGSVKRFKTLDYEGTQARVVKRDNAVQIRFARERIVVQDEDGEFRY